MREGSPVDERRSVSAPARDRTLDVLRAVATVRVVVYHGTGDNRWSWVAAMPLMFFVGGSLYAQSLSRRPPREVLRTRLRRILVPTWGWSVFVFGVYTVTGAWGRVPWWGIPGFVAPIVPAAGTGAAAGGDVAALDPLYWTYMGLWYITAYTIFMIIGIPLRRFQQRHPVVCISLLAAPVLLSALTQIHELGALTFMLVFWVLGYVHHDHRSEQAPVALGVGLALGSSALGLAYALATQPSLDMNIINVPFVLDAMGFGAVCLVLAARPLIARVVTIHAVDVVVSWFQQRALTIYLWHPFALGIVWWLHGRQQPIHWSYVWFFLEMVPITFVLVTAMGWLEDVAARRRPQMVPKFSGVVDLRRPPIDLSPWIPPEPRSAAGRSTTTTRVVRSETDGGPP